MRCFVNNKLSSSDFESGSSKNFSRVYNVARKSKLWGHQVFFRFAFYSIKTNQHTAFTVCYLTAPSTIKEQPRSCRTATEHERFPLLPSSLDEECIDWQQIYALVGTAKVNAYKYLIEFKTLESLGAPQECHNVSIAFLLSNCSCYIAPSSQILFQTSQTVLQQKILKYHSHRQNLFLAIQLSLNS